MDIDFHIDNLDSSYSANILVDFLVIYLSLKCLKIEKPMQKVKNTIFRAVCFGFISDLVGSVFLFLFTIIPYSENTVFGKKWGSIVDSMISNPFKNVFSLLFVLIAILIAGILIYILNKEYNFSQLEIEEKQKKKLALYMAIFTAPYLFLLPLEWFFVK